MASRPQLARLLLALCLAAAAAAAAAAADGGAGSDSPSSGGGESGGGAAAPFSVHTVVPTECTMYFTCALPLLLPEAQDLLDDCRPAA